MEEPKPKEEVVVTQERTFYPPQEVGPWIWVKDGTRAPNDASETSVRNGYYERRYRLPDGLSQVCIRVELELPSKAGARATISQVWGVDGTLLSRAVRPLHEENWSRAMALAIAEAEYLANVRGITSRAAAAEGIRGARLREDVPEKMKDARQKIFDREVQAGRPVYLTGGGLTHMDTNGKNPRVSSMKNYTVDVQPLAWIGTPQKEEFLSRGAGGSPVLASIVEEGSNLMLRIANRDGTIALRMRFELKDLVPSAVKALWERARTLAYTMTLLFNNIVRRDALSLPVREQDYINLLTTHISTWADKHNAYHYRHGLPRLTAPVGHELSEFQYSVDEERKKAWEELYGLVDTFLRTGALPGGIQDLLKMGVVSDRVEEDAGAYPQSQTTNSIPETLNLLKDDTQMPTEKAAPPDTNYGFAGTAPTPGPASYPNTPMTREQELEAQLAALRLYNEKLEYQLRDTQDELAKAQAAPTTFELLAAGGEMGLVSGIIEVLARRAIMAGGGNPRNPIALHSAKVGLVLSIRHMAIPLMGDKLPQREFIEARVDRAIQGVSATAAFDATQQLMSLVGPAWQLLSFGSVTEGARMLGDLKNVTDAEEETYMRDFETRRDKASIG